MNSWLTRVLCAVVQLVATCGQIQPLATCPASADFEKLSNDRDQPAVCSKSLGLDARVQIEPAYGGRSVEYFNYSQTFSVTFWNRMGKDIRLFYKPKDENQTHTDFGIMRDQQSLTFNSYQDHEWYAKVDASDEIAQLHAVVHSESHYFFETPEVQAQKDKEFEAEKAKFKADYKARTGKEWIQTYPREPVSFPMYDTVELGHKQYITSDAALWYNTSFKECEKRNSKLDESEGETCEYESVRPAMQTNVFTVETVSVSPQVFVVPDCLSIEETDLIIELAQPNLERSLVSSEGVVSQTRTSDTCWLAPENNEILDNIFNRVADIVQMPRNLIKNTISAESLQVVRYNTSGEYQRHHDYLDPAIHPNETHVQRGNNRLATFLIYLESPLEGGGTHFPLSTAAKDGEEGIKVVLPKGSVVLFYHMFKDGNLDPETLHAGLPVEKGNKYISNIWIWEPRFR